MGRHLLVFVVLAVALATACARTYKPKSVTINILHTNDQHARFDQVSKSAGSCSVADAKGGYCLGGYARMATLIKQYRAADPETLVLDAGDQYTGTMFDALFRGNLSSLFLTQLGYNATTLGNHEFDFGAEVLGRNLQTAQALAADRPMLGACNVDVSRQPALQGLLSKWAVFKVKGFKIAVLGLLTAETNYADLRSADNVTVLDEIPALKACLKQLKKEVDNVDVTVLLSHVGYPLDKVIAANVSGIDLIIGGHSHSMLFGNGSQAGMPNMNTTAASPLQDTVVGPYPTWVTNNATGKAVPVTTAYYASKYMGALQLTLDPTTRKLVAVGGRPVMLGGLASSSPVLQDPEVAGMVNTYGSGIAAYVQTPIGSSVRPLARAPYGNESAIGNLFCASEVAYWHSNEFEEDNGPLYICLQNSGGLRADLPGGNLTVGDAFNVVPFGNTLVVKQFTGDVIVKALESGVSTFGTTSSQARFAQVAGLRYVYDPARPAGSRVVKAVAVNSQGQEAALDPCKTYNVATIDYLIAGGDGYSVLANNGKTLIAAGPTQDYAIITYITQNSPLDASTDGRIAVCTGGPNDDPACSSPMEPLAACSGTVDPKAV